MDDLKAFLEEKVNEFEQTSFIESDPISIPHRYDRLQDIEISGLLVATIAWGRRDLIIRSGNRLMEIMEDSPFDFVMNPENDDHPDVLNFKHRTFNGEDLRFFLKSLRSIYQKHDSLETLFNVGNNIGEGITNFRSHFFAEIEKSRTFKHVSDPSNGSAAKRLCMYTRWMVRSANRNVDFGLWKSIPSSALMCPLDVHSGNVARALGILHRKQNDWKAVVELTNALKKLDKSDPVKYDFALFGLGVFEGFK